MHFSEITKLQFGIKRHTLLCILQAIKATTFSVVGKTQQLNNAKKPFPKLVTTRSKLSDLGTKARNLFQVDFLPTISTVDSNQEKSEFKDLRVEYL